MATMTLHLFVKKKYFEQIESGEKTEEFRLKSKWSKRIAGKCYTKICLHKCYTSDVVMFDYEEPTTKKIKSEIYGGVVEVLAFPLKRIRYV